MKKMIVLMMALAYACSALLVAAPKSLRVDLSKEKVGLWTFNKGVRQFVKKGTENMPLQIGTWNEIKIAVHGTQLTGWLNGKHLLDYTPAEPVSGKVGLWSKTDSVSYFDEFTVTPMAK